MRTLQLGREAGGFAHVVMVSRDKSEEDWRAALTADHIPDSWLSLDWSLRDYAARLEMALGVTGVPSVAVLRVADSAIVSAVSTARAEIVKGPPSAVLTKWTGDAVDRKDLPALPPLAGE